MQKYLMTIALGPVQEFIAAARRTADLTAGSELLVGLAGHLADYLQRQHDAELIFPASTQTDAPNKLLFTVQGEPHKIAADAKEQAHKYLRDQWDSCLQQLSNPVKACIDTRLAEEQLQHFLEFYAAWVPLNGDYAAARRRLEQLLAGRKALRDFEQPQSSQLLPKSPLDPSRDTVIKLQDGFRVCEAAQQNAWLRLKPRETLDAIALLKRVKGRESSRKVPSTSEMALRSIWRLAKARASEAVQQMEAIAQRLELSEASDLFFPGRWDDLDTDQPLDEATQKQLQELRKAILKSVAVPEDSVAYYAVLLADGDRMGKRISELETIEAHKGFSKQVADFAQRVSQIVEQHGGYLIYCGGDDVLALLPAPRALECADALQRAFRDAVPNATLSAGVALAHHLDDLQRVLGWARQAESAAKRVRNALAVALHPRSGEAMTAVTAWDDFGIWRRWIDAFRKGLARGFPYELHALARDYEPNQIAPEILSAEAKRVLERKEGKELPVSFPEWAVQSPSCLKKFAQLLIIARFLAEYPEREAQ
jgi:CRISPR-associated protein Cmr2